VKIQLYNQRDKNIFPVYPYTADVNFLQNRLKRPDGLGDYQVFLVSNGKGILEIGGEAYSLEKNDLFYLASDISHGYYGITDDFSTTYLSFNGEGVKRLEEYYGLCGFGVYKGKSKGIFEEELIKLFDMMDSGEWASVLCAEAYRVVVSFFTEAFSKEQSIPEKVYSYLERNYASPVTLDEILKLCPYSKTKLSEEFRKEYGITVFEALGIIRLRHARRMIRENPYLTIDKAAQECGFSDASYFCKMYKKRFGISPAASRKG